MLEEGGKKQTLYAEILDLKKIEYHCSAKGLLYSFVYFKNSNNNKNNIIIIMIIRITNKLEMCPYDTDAHAYCLQ